MSRKTSKKALASKGSPSTDVLTPQQRSHCMSRIRGKDTVPELVVRRLVHALGYGFRLHRRDLPGTPDMVFVRHKRVILIHGCFWHRHSCKLGQPNPKQNARFWKAKLRGNVERDKRNLRELRRQGWTVLTIWECQIGDLVGLRRRIATFLR